MSSLTHLTKFDGKEKSLRAFKRWRRDVELALMTGQLRREHWGMLLLYNKGCKQVASGCKNQCVRRDSNLGSSNNSSDALTTKLRTARSLQAKSRVSICTLPPTPRNPRELGAEISTNPR